MTYFPQLSTGALTQYPITKKISRRTVVNLLEDGSRVVLADANAAAIQWEMVYEGLSDEEASSLRSFFASVEGRLHSFTFFDPVGNLLGWSETLSAEAWQKNGLLAVVPSVADPLGTTRASAIANSSAGTLALRQELSIPGAVTTCWSFYARSETPHTFALTRRSAGTSASVLGRATSDWHRFELSSTLPDGADTSVFELSLSAAGTLDLFGFQVEAQPAASQYVPTAADGGVYPSARFDTDEINIIATAPNRNSCALRLMTKVNG